MQLRITHDQAVALHQFEREAIVDLLNLCIYADAFIALKEGSFLSQVVMALHWDPNVSFRNYDAKSIEAALQARKNPAARDDFLARAKSRLASPPARALALDLCEQLFAADGKTGENETALLAEIRTALS